METKKKSKLLKLWLKFRKAIILWLLISLVFIMSSLWIYSSPQVDDTFNKAIAELLMTIGQAIIGAGLIGGGIGGVVNFIFEEFKEEEEEAKKLLEKFQEIREKRKIFRGKLQNKLQNVHDDVELSRVLIKSHKSGKTYGEQIRTRIMPSLISLKDLKRRLAHSEDLQLEPNLNHLQVSLTYMIAYLSVLMDEFEANYLEISNLQNYQDAMANRMRTFFTDITEGKKEGVVSLEKKVRFLESAEQLFGKTDVPSNIEVVWKAMEKLDYLKDFIKEKSKEKTNKSMYHTYFLPHYYHCNKIIKTKDSKLNKKLIKEKDFITNLKEFKRIEELKNGDNELTNKDSLTRMIMETEFKFDFETSRKKL